MSSACTLKITLEKRYTAFPFA